MVYFIYDYFSPAYKAGGPIQSLNNLAMALKQELPVSIIASNKDLDTVALNVEADKWVDFKGVRVFYSSKNFWQFKSAMHQHQTLFVNGVYSLQYNLLPLLFYRGRKIVSVRGMLHPNALQLKKNKKSAFLIVWKLLGLHKKCEYHATSDQEKEYIQNLFGKQCRIWTIANLPKVLAQQSLPDKQLGDLVICTIALISPMKNLLPVLKAIRQLQVNLTYRIYGPVKDADYWEVCKSEIGSMPENIKVEYMGALEPEMIPQALAGAHVYVQPSKSENFGHSLFEALTAGRPVITSHNTPWNGLRDSAAGINVNPENEEEIRSAISFFAKMNGADLSMWSNNARNYAVQAMDVEKLKAAYLQMFVSVN